VTAWRHESGRRLATAAAAVKAGGICRLAHLLLYRASGIAEYERTALSRRRNKA